MENSEAGINPASFREIWFLDFEFSLDGGLPVPLCMVAIEYHTRKEMTFWRGEFPAESPFSRDTLLVGYFISAEMSCFSVLGWRIAENCIDLFAEFRAANNVSSQRKVPALLEVLTKLQIRNVSKFTTGEKSAMRNLILDDGVFSPEERQNILEYCRNDVQVLIPVFERLLPKMNEYTIIQRGAYMAALGVIEANGIPVDTALFSKLHSSLEQVLDQLIQDFDQSVYPIHYFNKSTRSWSRDLGKTEEMILSLGISWEYTKPPRDASEEVKKKHKPVIRTDTDTLKAKVALSPAIKEFYELESFKTLVRAFTSKSKNAKNIKISKDGFTRCVLGGFGTITARNAASTTRWIFGNATWIRGLIRPPEGYALAYLDWSQQEIAIAAGLSGDEKLIAAYESGDVYLAFAKQAGLVRQTATKKSHEAIRQACKAIVLGIAYGKEAESIAEDAPRLTRPDGTQRQMTRHEAGRLLAAHKATYHVFWRWINRQINAFIWGGEDLDTDHGWKLYREESDREDMRRTLLNFPMQSIGAIMMQRAATDGIKSGIRICTPVHDAFLIMSKEEDIDRDVTRMAKIMQHHSREVCGLEIRVGVKIIRYPDRYMDEDRGIVMFNKIMAAIGEPLYQQQ